jgi:hypothetical protein
MVRIRILRIQGEVIQNIGVAKTMRRELQIPAAPFLNVVVVTPTGPSAEVAWPKLAKV